MKRFDAGEWYDSPLSRRRLDLSSLQHQLSTVRRIVDDVRSRGDDALREYGRKFDGWAPATEEGFEVPREELDKAASKLQPKQRDALELAAARIRAFHETQKPEAVTGKPGLKLITKPVQSAGLYIPGGRAAYPSTVLMTAIPARVAGVEEIAIATPPNADGSVSAAVLAAAGIADVDTVYRMGGAQAIAALAYGTSTVKRTDVIAGPGNVYVMLAKKEVYGSVGIDSLAGPTEIMVLADKSARPDFVAADLASQLEHDPLAWAVLVTDDATLAARVDEELRDLVQGLDRRDVIEAAHAAVVVATDMDEALKVVNEWAPEHLEIQAQDAGALAARVENAGAIFVGPYATVPLGDYVAGPNHTLPTAGAARFSSPLGVYSFLKRHSVASLNRGDLEMLKDACVALAELEGLTAHVHAVEVRLE